MGTQWTEASFYVIDYVIMGLFLVVSMVIGVYFGVIKKQQTTEEYLLGGRNMQLVPVALSMLVTFQSAISVMGTPMEVFAYDTMVYHIHIGIALSIIVQYFLLVPLLHPLKLISVYESAISVRGTPMEVFAHDTMIHIGTALAIIVQYFLLVPLLHPLKLTSIYEYLGKRFNSRAVQLLGTYIGMFQTLLYMAVVLFAPALALEAVANIPLWVSVIVIGIIGTLYTSLGGIKSVIWTDVFQFIMMYGGLVTILVLGGLKTGSLKKIIEIADEGGRLNFSSHSFDPRVRHTLWSCFIGGMFNWMPSVCNQSSVQRICSMRTENDAKRAVLLNIPLVLMHGVILVATGLVLYAYFVEYQCDPLQAGFITNANQIVPYFVMHVLSETPGLAGIFVAALFSGALSSLSSGINAMAANTLQDILINYLEEAVQIRKTLIAKFIVCLYGAMAVSLAYAIKGLSGPVTQISLTAFGATGSPVVGMLMLGAAFPKSNWIGAFAGGIIGMIFNIWLALSCLLFGNKTPMSTPITTAGCLANTTIGVANYTSADGTSGILYTTMDYPATTPQMAYDTSTTFPLYDISYLYLGLTGLIVSMTSGLLVSWFTGGDRGEPTDPIYIFPCLRNFWKIGYKTVQPPKVNPIHQLPS